MSISTDSKLNGPQAMDVDSHENLCDSSCGNEENISSSHSSYDEEHDPLIITMDDKVRAKLLNAGPVGVAAATAIGSVKNRHGSYSFENNPTLRKRHRTRLIRKIKTTLHEFSTRIGKQAISLVVSPGNSDGTYEVYGTNPLKYIISNFRSTIMEEFKGALAHRAPLPIPVDPTLFQLPPLIIDGIPTPLQQMTQAQLRSFIPLMLKYSTGRNKPEWGKEAARPVWWPEGIPWANVRADVRSKDEKQKLSWVTVLRDIVIRCYKFHGREDLLPEFTNDVALENANFV